MGKKWQAARADQRIHHLSSKHSSKHGGSRKNTKKRHVYFSDDLKHYTTPVKFHGCEKKLLWYCIDDLVAFRTETKLICSQSIGSMSNSQLIPQDRAFRPVTIGRHRASTSSGGQIYISQRILTRGLEYRCCFERQRRALVGRSCVLRQQAKINEPTELAKFASMCTAWATELALQQAAQDAKWARDDCCNTKEMKTINRRKSP